MGGNDPANDGSLVVTDSTVEGGAKLAARRIIVGSTPTIITGSASTAVSIAGHDEAHQVLLTTAAGIAQDVVVATVTFSAGWGLFLPCFALAAKTAQAMAGQPYVTNDTATSYQIFLHNPPALATAMVYDIVIFGR
jgi:hypothetical protein